MNVRTTVRTAGREALASILVFLIALPLSMGIAIACGAPPAAALLTAIIGGIVVGAISGSPLQVSGPAAGLTVLVYSIIEQFGLAGLSVAVFLSGLMQIAGAFAGLGRWFRAIPPAVIHGMLAGIGILIFLPQIYVSCDLTPPGSVLENFTGLWQLVSEILQNHTSQAALGLAALTIAVMVIWKRLGLEKKLVVPAALPAVISATVCGETLELGVETIELPTDLGSYVTLMKPSKLWSFLTLAILGAALELAIVASASSLLTAGAIDQMSPSSHTNYNKELAAQGIGNTLAGLTGGLPMSGVIARSTVNVEAGAQTRISTILHGVWILVAITSLPWLLSMVPVSCLAALLVYTGVKLVNPSTGKKFFAKSRFEGWIFITTAILVVTQGLLIGVIAGVMLAVLRAVWELSHLKVTQEKVDGTYCLHFEGACIFTRLPHLTAALEAIPADEQSISVHLGNVRVLDHACEEELTRFQKRGNTQGKQVSIDWGNHNFCSQAEPMPRS